MNALPQKPRFIQLEREEFDRMNAEVDAAGALRRCAEEVAAHLDELRDAWERGAIESRDGKNGSRSNRNLAMLYRLRIAIIQADSVLSPQGVQDAGVDDACKAELAQEAENRRALLAKLDPATREFAAREFAKLGLTQ